MKVAIILNGISRRKKHFYAHHYPALTEHFDVTVFETERSGHAIELAATAANQKFGVVIAAGGDGTVNQVLNGLIKANIDSDVPVLGVMPLGTGNDFAKTCGLSGDVHHLINLIKENRPKATDVCKLICHNESGNESVRYFLNCCSLGLGPDVVHRLEGNSRVLGHSLTYLKAIVLAFFKQRLAHVKCSSDGWQWKGNARVVAVANARTFGHGVCIGPDAVVDDGMLNVFTAGDFPTLQFVWLLHRLKAGKKLKAKGIHYHEAKSIDIISEKQVALEADGELAGFLPARIAISGKIALYR